MSTSTITIPAAYADDFRAALVLELKEEAKIVTEARQEALAEELAGGDRADLSATTTKAR
jgi:hypothetical protein